MLDRTLRIKTGNFPVRLSTWQNGVDVRVQSGVLPDRGWHDVPVCRRDGSAILYATHFDVQYIYAYLSHPLNSTMTLTFLASDTKMWLKGVSRLRVHRRRFVVIRMKRKDDNNNFNCATRLKSGTLLSYYRTMEPSSTRHAKNSIKQTLSY